MPRPTRKKVMRWVVGDTAYRTPQQAKAVVTMTKAIAGKSLTGRQKAQVKKLVRSEQETKYVSNALTIPGSSLNNLGNFVGFSTAITGTGEIYGCLPITAQGVDDFQRVGNKIKPSRVTVRLDLAVKDHVDNSALDRTVHVFLMSAKSVKSLDNYTAIPITLMMEKGDGTQTSFDGTTYNAQLPINRKEFTVHKHKVFRLVSGFGKSVGTTSASAGTTDSVISPSYSYARISMKVPTPKTLIYDRASATYPTNAAPFLVIGYTKNNNDGQDHVSMDYVSVLGQVQMYYKDA